jgi:hypothetical protein
MHENSNLRLCAVVLIISSILFHGCMVGTMGTIEANHLRYPVLFTYVMHDAAGNIIDGKDYDIISPFSFSFVQRGFNYPLSLKNNKDVSARLNSIIEYYNGHAIVGLSVTAENLTAYNFVPITIKSLGWIGILTGILMTANREQNGWSGPFVLGTSFAAVLFSPGFSRVTIQGEVIRFR